MTVYDAIENRRSIRKYKPDAVPVPILMKVLNAARLAPSGCAREARKLIVVRDKESKVKIGEACRSWFPGPRGKLHTNSNTADAPVVIVACNLVREANMRYFGFEDEDPIIFSNQSRKAGESRYWTEYEEHSKSNDRMGEYESMGIWDLAIALDHLSLAATGEGLGTCWIGVTDERVIRKILAIPDEVQARMIMTLGYPDVSPEPRPRKPLDEVVCYDTYS